MGPPRAPFGSEDAMTSSHPPPLRVVALGGGTGLPVVLQGLKSALFPPDWPLPRGRDCLTAVVTVADDGGSSGRLRRAYRLLAPGDARNCLLALSDGDGAMAALFRFRFGGDVEVGGHSLGNLILAGLSEVEGDLARAAERAGQMLGIRGRVLVATKEDVRLAATYEDGAEVVGESAITAAGRPIHRVRLLPESAAAPPEVLAAIRTADLVVIGPGSLYTSLMPVLLAKGLVPAIAASPARVVLVMNLMTEPGETDGYTAVDHLLAIRRHVPGLPLHDVLCNEAPLGEERIRRYSAERAAPVPLDLEALPALGCRILKRDLVAEGDKVRHDPGKLAAAILEAGADAGGRAVERHGAGGVLSREDVPMRARGRATS
jgi:uncharacterized cofD-like protein